MKALTLLYPRSQATRLTGAPSASQGKAHNTRKQVRQAVKLMPVSCAKRRLSVRGDSPAHRAH